MKRISITRPRRRFIIPALEKYGAAICTNILEIRKIIQAA
ncbi:hypothetical protein [Citrobacter pasteurii]|nr:hypothetical protein SF123566_8382 [Shigella flexneri 1235-66]CEJ66397.1 hypothetical protein [Citrobacter pasteurii]